MMVSNVQDSTPAPPLSYADRVKKSQRKDSASMGSAQRPQTRSQSSPSSTATPSAPKVAKLATLEPSAKSQGAIPAADRSVPSPPNAARTSSNAKPMNGETTSSAPDSQAGPSSATMKKAATSPAVNVWSLRKEQMARALSQQTPRGPDSSAQATAASENDATPTPVASASLSQGSTIPATEPHDAESVTNESIPDRDLPGAVVPTEDDEDAWVVRPYLAPNAVRLPALDASSWPEVGKAPTGDAPSTSQAGNSGGEPEDRVKKETQSSGSKRGEKTRWVPIPAEELRAAADAQRSARSSQSRSQSQHRAQNRGQSSASGSVGRSHHGSQERTKIQPSGNRERPSAPQSEMHSRTGSIQSSPRHVAARLRRLPDEVGGSSSRKSSRANSPRPYLPMGGPAAAGPAELPHGPIPQLDTINGIGYYPGVPHTHVPSPYSVTPPYPPPPGAIPIAYNPGYYPPYPYGAPQGQPYPMYWPTVHQDPRHPYAVSSQSQSPVTHPSSLTRSDDVSPPTSAGLSPAEENRESTVVPADAGAANAARDAQKPTLERKSSGGRQRILSFGSIRADGAIVGDEGGAGTAVKAGAGAEKSSSLGLDVGSLSISDNVDVTPRNGERPTFKLNAEVPAFSIGLARGDPGPLKNKLQAAAAVSSGPQSQTTNVSASIPSAINGDEKAHNASTLEPSWEFGTTKQEPEIKEAAPASEANGQSESTTSEGATNTSDLVTPDSVPLRLRLSPLGVNASGLPPTPIPPSAGPALYANNNPLAFENSSREDEWRVRDFGYGFGRPRPDGTYGPREDRPPRDKPYHGGRSAPRSYEADGFRRGFGGRRGRGGSRGYGRGRRGDYRGSFPRFPPRDAEYDVDEAYMYGPPDASVYFVPPPPPGTFMPPGFDPVYAYPGAYPLPPVPAAQPAAPVPTPVTKLSFPLDPTRYYLLGQLEYYLSEDNLAQDFYLRKQMDSHGWISSRLLASFPRVKILTYDLQLVKDVLNLSSLVEVKDEFVRPYKWSRYVLPTAKASIIEGGATLPVDSTITQIDVEQLLLHNPPPKSGPDASGTAVPPQFTSQQVVEQVHVHEHAAEGEQEYEEEDDEEDDVVFVLGQDDSQPWITERKSES